MWAFFLLHLLLGDRRSVFAMSVPSDEDQGGMQEGGGRETRELVVLHYFPVSFFWPGGVRQAQCNRLRLVCAGFVCNGAVVACVLSVW